ncbi:hypothetical protein ACFVZ3_21435 [Kitasatospora purpeofusca]|uniref:hypothetical protein n=1 Tax=Kitasatospora purpeofusca TaxID=67352 RepID=UPI0036AB3A7F
MEAEIAQLVTTGATTVVGLMATEAWTQARSRLAALFGRGRNAEEVSAELEEIRVEVVRADGDAELVGDQAAELRNRLRRLLREDPRAAEELESLLREFAPRAQQPGTTVHNEIHNGTFNESVFQAGRITYNNAPPPPAKD